MNVLTTEFEYPVFIQDIDGDVYLGVYVTSVIKNWFEESDVTAPLPEPTYNYYTGIRVRDWLYMSPSDQELEILAAIEEFLKEL